MSEIKQKSISNTLLSTLVISMIIATIFGVAIGRYVFPRAVTISYISQQELLHLERERLKIQGIEKQQLFLGKPKQAIELLKVYQEKMSTVYHIVLMSEKAIFGYNIKSISDKAHKDIINILQQGK
jgi:hypothetical protein